MRACSGTGAEDAPEALRADLKLEQQARPALQDGIAHCESVRDYISRLETQLALIDKEGLQNWLQSQAGSPS